LSIFCADAAKLVAIHNTSQASGLPANAHADGVRNIFSSRQ
jgi:hypothetical protein